MCGCARRRERLNQLRPGLGDAVAAVAEPIKEAYMRIRFGVPEVLAFLAGAFLVPHVLAYLRRPR